MDVNGQGQKAAIFASGTGSNAVNILRRIAEVPDAPKIVCLICDKLDADVVKKAQEFDIVVHLIPKDGTKRQHEDAILAALQDHSISWIFLAGYMRIFSPEFLAEFYDSDLNINRVVNMHPSLLPDFPGRDGYGDAYAAGVKKHGCTVHFVDDGIDSGPIILQRSYDVVAVESLASFKSRGLAQEHELYIDALKALFNRGEMKCRQSG